LGLQRLWIFVTSVGHMNSAYQIYIKDIKTIWLYVKSVAFQNKLPC